MALFYPNNQRTISAWARPPVVGLLVLALAACSRQPPPALPTPPAQPATASSFNLPVNVPLQNVYAQIEDQVPDRLSQWDNPVSYGASPIGGKLGIRYAVRRDPLQFSMQGNRLTVGFHIHYKVALVQRVFGHWLAVGSCGVREPERQLTGSITTTIGWGSDWRLHAASSQQHIDTQDRCDLTFMHINVNNAVTYMATHILANATHRLDETLPTLVNLQPQAQALWQHLNAPIRIGPDAWLAVQPQSVAAMQINAVQQQLSTGLRLTAWPQLVLGARPRPTVSPLPALQVVPRQADGFYMALKTSIPYAALDRQLADPDNGVAGQVVDLGVGSLRVLGARVYSANGVPVVDLKTAGLVHGVRITGHPVFDATTQTLTLAQPDYQITAGPLWARFLGWLFQIPIRHRLEDLLRFNLQPEVGQITQRLEKTINRPLDRRTVIQGHIDQLQAQRIRASADGLDALLTATGKAQLLMH